jgi:hypothetical protein
MVDCQVCDRSHAPSHPHIANIEGDGPIDDAPEPKDETKVFGVLPPDQQLPEWLRDKPGSRAIRPSTGTEEQVDPTKLCQVCGKPWAPKHACKGAESAETDFNRPKQHVTPYHMRKHAKCDVYGKKQQSNHVCKGRPETASPLTTSAEASQRTAPSSRCGMTQDDRTRRSKSTTFTGETGPERLEAQSRRPPSAENRPSRGSAGPVLV